jgi:MoaA/NifB/PqqE/SkfB family radical SAM enzyme
VIIDDYAAISDDRQSVIAVDERGLHVVACSAASVVPLLEVTGQRRLECVHCYANSSPAGTRGTMTTVSWARVIDQAADLGIRTVQFIGGEPTLYPRCLT